MIGDNLKIVHIHSDRKFIHTTRKFEGHGILNIIILVTHDDSLLKEDYGESILLFKYSRKSKELIVDICNNSDAIVLHSLSSAQIKIALAVSPRITLLWRFFGYELYGKMKHFCLSEETIRAKKLSRIKRLFVLINNPKLLKKEVLRFHTSINNEFRRAITRIDYFIGYSIEEYELLKDSFPSLPPFIKLNLHFQLSDNIDLDFRKKRIVVIGNNRADYNNHLDIIKLVDQSQKKHEVEFQLLFNYGPENSYSRCVRHSAITSDKICLIEAFFNKEEFHEYYKNVTALVINGFRQMALANIFEAIKNGAKVYLNEKNTVLHWLKSEGMSVFTITDFKKDLDTDNFYLSESEVGNNIKQLIRLSSDYDSKDFQNEIINAIRKG